MWHKIWIRPSQENFIGIAIVEALQIIVAFSSVFILLDE